jgi:hypothetical protein
VLERELLPERSERLVVRLRHREDDGRALRDPL